jgi:hypothetical protein
LLFQAKERQMSRFDSRRVFYILLGLALPVALAAQADKGPAPKAAPKTSAIPRTADGKPDLQGTWDFAQLTPFERPDTLAGKSSFASDDEAEEFAQATQAKKPNMDRRDGGAAADVERAYNDFWWDFGSRVAKQTSLVVDPANGRVPPLTAAASARAEQRRGQGQRYDNPEERPLAERCILGFNSGPPMVPSAYNNNMQLVQTRDSVLIFNEMIHSARVIDLRRTSHLAQDVRPLTGDSIGHWEGDTLVVDTTNFLKEGGFRGASANMHLIERFSLDGQNTLRYKFTVDDPATWTASWTASIPMARTSEQIFEYACHEANYGLENVLKGGRYRDQRGATK